MAQDMEKMVLVLKSGKVIVITKPDLKNLKHKEHSKLFENPMLVIEALGHIKGHWKKEFHLIKIEEVAAITITWPGKRD